MLHQAFVGEMSGQEKCRFGKHLAVPTRGVREHKFYLTVLRDHGPALADRAATPAASADKRE